MQGCLPIFSVYAWTWTTVVDLTSRRHGLQPLHHLCRQKLNSGYDPFAISSSRSLKAAMLMAGLTYSCSANLWLPT